jgi:hypothetical protein
MLLCGTSVSKKQESATGLFGFVFTFRDQTFAPGGCCQIVSLSVTERPMAIMNACPTACRRGPGHATRLAWTALSM